MKLNVYIVLLIMMLAIISIGNSLVAIINPETYFFGNKLGGTPATIYLLINSFICGIIIYTLYSDNRYSLTLSLLYFIFNIFESFITSVTIFHEYRPSIISLFGSILTIFIYSKGSIYGKF